MASLTDIITRKYNNFRGVDFTGGNVEYYRSPDALNMWRNYLDDDCVQTRPGMKLLGECNAKIYGMFFINISSVLHCVIHKGVSLVEWTNYPSVPAVFSVLKATGMNPGYSKSFIYDDTLFIIDGINYLEYNGTQVTDVEGTIPYTSYYRNPDGSSNLDESTDIDTVYQPVNMITYKRKNRFIGDGISSVYYLDAYDLMDVALFSPVVVINDVVQTITTNFTYDKTRGTITFVTPPNEGDVVVVTFGKNVEGYANRIKNCTLLAEFDNRFFFSGNPNFPNMVYHCQLDDPRYFPDILQNSCGIDLSDIKALVPGNNVLWVIKEIEQEQSSIHYLAGTYADDGSRCYQDVTGSINSGCLATGVNFNDDVVFLSNKGLESINSSTMYSEQILAHRSSNIDLKLLNELNYSNIKLAEWRGYLFCLVNSHIYLADSRQMYQNPTNQYEYEWFYWELKNNITYITEYRDTLYLCNDRGDIYKLDGIVDETTDINENVIVPGVGNKYYEINSYWTTKKEDFGYQGYTKTTNKRGNVASVKPMDNDEIRLDTIVDGTAKFKNIYSDIKGYFPYRIKDKKFKDIQLKFSSNKPFGLFSCTLEGFIAGYIKR